LSFPPFFKKQDDTIFLTIKLHPKSSKNKIIVDDFSLEIFVTDPPLKGKANQALIKYMSKIFTVPISSLEIVSGFKSRIKVISITGLSAEMILKKLMNFKS